MILGIVKPEILLAQVDDLLRSMPADLNADAPEVLSWRGRVSAVLREWGFRSYELDHSFKLIDDPNNSNWNVIGRKQLILLLHEARHSFLLKSPKAGSLVIGEGEVFKYFDELRKIIELAKTDIFFIDRYIDPSFIARYLPHVGTGVPIRLLSRERIEALLPAVDAFVRQHKTQIQVRSSPSIHDRFVFIDRMQVYQSGASFKDGAKNAPVTMTQIIDAFSKVLEVYEGLWDVAKVER